MKKALHLLEFEEIRERLGSFTVTASGAHKVSLLSPSVALEKVAVLQQETSEAVGIILQKGFDFQGCGDLKPLLRRAVRGGILTPPELETCLDFFQAVEALKKHFSKEKQEGRAPRFLKLVQRCRSFPHLAAELQRCLDRHGGIRDSASPLLSSLRAEERRVLERINQSLTAYLHAPQYRKYLQENLITVRAGRHVLLVKQEYRSQIPGIVHDQSSSGATLYIEPLPAVELNNRQQEVKRRIEAEIEQILRRLTGLVGTNVEGITESHNLYGELDFILARGQLSLAQGGREPFLNDRGFIHILGGRHPLLPPDEVIPIDIHLGRDFNTLIITGPNTGGKTVTLKTIGLFTLMAQCGLHVPAKRGTELSVFAGIWADIGDEQDIAQSLSTFSGHMTHIIQILKEAGSSALVLLDELGAGTDPSEGSALAMAVLEELHSRGVRTVATTHINELKVFAHLRSGMANASMEFDPQSLSPTFRLLIGVPGQSNALTIARRLGMAPGIIERARSYMREDLLNLEEVVSGLVEEKHRYAQDSEKVKELESRLHFLLLELQEEKDELARQKRKVLARARQEARETIRSVQRKTENIFKKLKQAERRQPQEEIHKVIRETRQELRSLQKEHSEEVHREEGSGQPLRQQEIKIGQPVYIRSLRCQGKITRVLSDKEVQVQAGLLKINTAPDDLEKPKQNRENKENGEKIDRKSGAEKEKLSRRNLALLWEKSAVNRSIDLRGLTLDEAVLRVEKHLDDSILADLHEIEIIHGKGTGRLRRGLHHYLAEKKGVAGYRLGGEGEGGSGVTIVRLQG